ncbi:helix-turn-helix domain-containing protein [Dehalococcoides mccartyi]|uniref:helix-turn-helix domain-containing protein n=1 Tax=Dehalococcoides mccartyi TaxID=61435 RepID=UPI000805D4EC|nr:helix-turn-helix domain-containing protein [Dehalococcoides mccartyi]OBW61977.1 MAG: hypothetical protein A9181_03140 [Dehalococcoides mccartyi]
MAVHGEVKEYPKNKADNSLDSNHVFNNWIDTHPDDGCEYAKSCLNCHLPNCIWDTDRWKDRVQIRGKFDEWKELHIKGETASSISSKLGISVDTCYTYAKKFAEVS